MKEEKKEEIKKSIEFAKKELEQLKENDPNGNYQTYEQMINQLSSLLEGEFPKGFARKMIVKFILGTLFLFLVSFVWIAAIFGFSSSLLNPISPYKFLYIIPSISLLLVILMRLLVMIMNHTSWNPFSVLLLFSFTSIFGLAFLDSYWIHLCRTLDSSFLLATIVWLSFIGLDLWIQRKIFL